MLMLIALLGGLLVSTQVSSAAPVLSVDIAYIARAEEPVIPLSLLDIPVENNGLKGAELGLSDNQTTGDFLGHSYQLNTLLVQQDIPIEVAIQDVLTDSLNPAQRDKIRLLVVNLVADELLAVADAFPDALLLNTRAQDDRLRNADCRPNVLHIAPSRAMLADALVQYLAWKKWDELVLVTGRHPNDALFALAMDRAVGRFGLKWREKKNWTAVPGARRTDSGHHSLQREVPIFSRFKKHDVVIVADETDEFGEYFSYRTSEPRPVAGTQGLIPSAWHRSQEQWGATQIQRRFTKIAGRFMTDLDYGSWAAMRTLGEAVTKTSSVDPSTLEQHILSGDFNLAGFKGVPLSFRSWNGQLRQPVLIAGPRMLVSVSPQEGFLHQVSTLDTLGYDQPESACTHFTERP